ncbi:MAG: lipoyl synthase [Proteobacteria bacterium]|nr:MAG: lipoyl synthase [Pseudomonadota bacterium]
MKFPIVQPTRPRLARQRAPKPKWLKVKAPSGPRYESVRQRMEGLELFTVCKEAACPNMGECWGGGTATIMLMGGICTRACRFCAVDSGRPLPLDPAEPYNAARAVVELGVEYIVLTSVDRDDLPDGGASHFATCVNELKRLDPRIMVEVLIGDFAGRTEDVDTIVATGCEVIAHNVETVPRLQRRVRDARAGWDRSVAVLDHIKRAGRGRGPDGVDILSKTSVMVGVGETEDEVIEAMKRLRQVDTDVITFGQYLRPSAKHLEVAEFVPPDQFDRYADIARELGFLYVASGPLVRSSYRAGEFYLRAHVDRQRALKGGA